MEAVTLRTVGTGAGVSRSAAYRHFANKEAMLAAMSLASWEQLTARVEQIAADSTLPPDKALHAAINALMTIARNRPNLYRLMLLRAPFRPHRGHRRQSPIAGRLPHPGQPRRPARPRPPVLGPPPRRRPRNRRPRSRRLPRRREVACRRRSAHRATDPHFAAPLIRGLVGLSARSTRRNNLGPSRLELQEDPSHTAPSNHDHLADPAILCQQIPGSSPRALRRTENPTKCSRRQTSSSRT
ncbi:TetR/AcrR family transcriptional regulator [Nocardia sp. BMG51109]|uniref:TetR/AcrR family transcriptional regulator n=1 Tax=Nocardia sp. BMG51109 TaxID=1056816 RepID=UPI001E58FE33|nr:TetR/AcrR family transcriptional regulator [Nocardia sp. BMG51109]